MLKLENEHALQLHPHRGSNWSAWCSAPLQMAPTAHALICPVGDKSLTDFQTPHLFACLPLNISTNQVQAQS